ncbi:MAG: hypothetical protein A2381_05670 [Bdellovibrionales bacterium RIFOXYB1_FULL_37_110]|nr:MAG: hypothetical protein A2417_06285 [Bdellovibrionales bacterium RIFOXYC1_FULL_37_79]OFZ58540.1 MAG: hypothetical protein A2381_05670 [Bdellovibrionales bacterium RIFOXYB1_FULL_37_110]OFZ63760.1 MAG: hypothetical protein A2577_07420 [Bdellovibrionales bacterium RIFOXYD1_FULL_36_51]
MLSSKTKIIRKKVPWQELDEKIVILSPVTRMSHELNETSSWIWKEIQQEISFEKLLGQLIENFEVDDVVAHQDLQEVLMIFQEKGLIEIND